MTTDRDPQNRRRERQAGFALGALLAGAGLMAWWGTVPPLRDAVVVVFVTGGLIMAAAARRAYWIAAVCGLVAVPVLAGGLFLAAVYIMIANSPHLM